MNENKLILEEMINKKIISRTIESPLNDEYKKLCIESGKELEAIMRSYAQAEHEARNIMVY